MQLSDDDLTVTRDLTTTPIDLKLSLLDTFSSGGKPPSQS